MNSISYHCDLWFDFCFFFFFFPGVASFHQLTYSLKLHSSFVCYLMARGQTNCDKKEDYSIVTMAFGFFTWKGCDVEISIFFKNKCVTLLSKYCYHNIKIILFYYLNKLIAKNNCFHILKHKLTSKIVY